MARLGHGIIELRPFDVKKIVTALERNEIRTLQRCLSHCLFVERNENLHCRLQISP